MLKDSKPAERMLGEGRDIASQTLLLSRTMWWMLVSELIRGCDLEASDLCKNKFKDRDKERTRVQQLMAFSDSA